MVTLDRHVVVTDAYVGRAHRLLASGTTAPGFGEDALSRAASGA